MNTLRLQLYLIVSVFFSIFIFNANSASLPTRSQCIQKVNLDWQGQVIWNKEILRSQIFEGVQSSAQKIFGKNFMLQAAIPLRNRDVLYLQFAQECERKDILAQMLIDEVKVAVGALPVLKLSSEIVQPGVDTIDVWGASWSDRPGEEVHEYEKAK